MIRLDQLPKHLSVNSLQAFNLAEENAKNLCHAYIGREHLLLGILQIPECTAYRTLKQMKLDPEELKSKLLEMLPVGPADTNTDNIVFTPPVGKMIRHADSRAKRLEFTQVDTVFLLLGLLDFTDPGITTIFLKENKITQKEIYMAFKELLVPA